MAYTFLVEVYFWSFVHCSTAFLRYFEHRLAAEAKHLCKDVGWERFYSVVKLTCCRIEEAAYGSQIVLNIRNFVLELDKVLVCF